MPKLQKSARNLTQIQHQNGHGNHMRSCHFQLRCHQSHPAFPLCQTESALYLYPLAFVPIILRMIANLALPWSTKSRPRQPDTTVLTVAEILPVPVIPGGDPGVFPEKQFGVVSVVIDDVVYAGLGQTGNGIAGVSYCKHLWASDDVMQSWESVADCPTEANGIIRGVACGDRLFVLDTNLDIWRFDPGTGEWNKQNTSLRTTLSGGMVNNIFMFSSGNMIYIGMTNGSKRFIKYDPSWDN